MKRTAFYLSCAFALMGACLWMAVSMGQTTHEQSVPCRGPDRMESYTVGSFDRLQIRKTYVLAPEETSGCISTTDFEEYGSCFHLYELVQEHIDGVEVCTAVFNEMPSTP